MLSLRKYFYIPLIYTFLALVSCQSEIEEQKTNSQVTITKTSPLTSYMQRVAMVKTAADNIIDKSSYCTIKIPYTITVNNTTIAINSIEDYKKVIDNINASSSDDDIVKIIFPVTMIYYNYEEEFIEKESDFNELLSYWEKYPDLWAKINCLNINYPIVINVYNSYNQIANTETILNDESLFNFINSLNGNQLIAISYPISVKDDDNQIKTIVSNSQFEDAIKDAIDHCNLNINTALNFIQTITIDSWKVTYLFDDYDRTQIYKDYEFVFKSDYTVKATKFGLITNGTWETRVDNGVREFKMLFDSSSPLHDLEEDWKLFEFNNSQIRFRGDTSNGGTQTDYLYLSKI